MPFVPVASRTVTPDPNAIQCGCGIDSALVWPQKSPYNNTTFWLDASLECAADNVTVEQFSYSQIYGDNNLVVLQQLKVGNVCGLYLSGGTSNTDYAFRIAALMSDDSLVTWDVSLPINNNDVPWPTDIVTNTVLINGAVLLYAGRSLPVTNGS